LSDQDPGNQPPYVPGGPYRLDKNPVRGPAYDPSLPPELKSLMDWGRSMMKEPLKFVELTLRVTPSEGMEILALLERLRK